MPPISTRDVFRLLAGSELPEWPTLERAATSRRLEPGDPIFLAGERRPFIFVLNEGVVRMSYEMPNGDSWVKAFVEAGVCFASHTSLETDGMTSFSAYAEVDSTVDQIDYHTIVQLANEHIEWQRAVSNALRYYGERKERREMELLTLSPVERYLRFLRDYPNLATVIRQRDIASYVRITPVALSRIKSRLKRRGKEKE